MKQGAHLEDGRGDAEEVGVDGLAGHLRAVEHGHELLGLGVVLEAFLQQVDEEADLGKSCV